MRPREHWQEAVESVGLVYAMTEHPDGRVLPYWHEGAAYVLETGEVDELERVTEELHGMCLEAARFLATGAMGDLGLPPGSLEHVRADLARPTHSVYGRFDLRWDGRDDRPPLLLEYNADTPTGLVEAAVAQWYWLADVAPGRDQWNSLHERLVLAWEGVRAASGRDVLHLAHLGAEPSGEEWMTVAYLRDTAVQAGWTTHGLEVEQVGWDADRERFVGLGGEEVEVLFKLYPWEDVLAEPFGPHAVASPTLWVEPLWKVVLSNKALLAALWHLYPGHENLLPAHLDEPRGLREWVRKPLHGREGSNITVSAPGLRVERPGPYGEEGWCYQQHVPMPDFDGSHPVVGSWVVAGRSAGCGIRESDAPVTDDLARFVPHLVDAPAPAPEQAARWLRE